MDKKNVSMGDILTFSKIEEYELLTLALALTLALVRRLLLGLWSDLFWWFRLADRKSVV
jgi:hypothetical protein